MDTMSVTQRVKQFDQKHGEERYGDGGIVYFRDGSIREVDPYGLLQGGEQLDLKNPEEEYKLASRKLKFHQLKLQRAVDAFDDLHTRLSHFKPANEAEELARLREMQKIIEGLKLEVQKAEKGVNATRIGKARRGRVEGLAEETQRFNEFQARRRAIKV